MNNKKKKTHDYSELINVVVFVVVVILFIGVYLAGGQKGGIKSAFINTEKAYVENSEAARQTTKEILTKKKKTEEKETEKIKIPYNKYSFNYRYTLNVKGSALNVTFRTAVPKDENDKQYISELNFSPKPTRTYNDGVNNIAEFKFENIKDTNLNVVISGIANQRTYDYETAKVLNRNSHKEADLTQYVKPAKFIESDNAEIIKVAKSLRGQTQQETVGNVFNYLQKNLKYNVNTKMMGAKDVLRLKQGKCMDYSNLMIALLRANNIPARYVVGYMIVEGYNYHAWVEVYYDNYGWVVYDPTVSAMPLYYKDANGQTHKKEMKIDPSKSLGRRYIASARNMASAYNMMCQSQSNSKPAINLSENVQIKKID